MGCAVCTIWKASFEPPFRSGCVDLLSDLYDLRTPTGSADLDQHCSCRSAVVAKLAEQNDNRGGVWRKSS